MQLAEPLPRGGASAQPPALVPPHCCGQLGRAVLVISAIQPLLGAVRGDWCRPDRQRGDVGPARWQPHTVVVHDLDRLNKDARVAEGAVWADSLASAAVEPEDTQGSAVTVVTAVPAPPHVRAVMEGDMQEIVPVALLL